MDRRLYNAYDKMTMPDDCSQRIEKLLREGTKVKPQGRNQVILRQKSRWQTWGSATALVCLAVLISLSGVMVFLGLEQQRDSQNIPRFSQSTEHSGKTGDFPLSDSGERFLLKMCQAMPDWESYYVLDDDFWEEFLFYSFTNPEKVAGEKAETIIGELPVESNTVLLSRKRAEAYAFLTMGCDLPLPSEEQENSRIQYADGVYHIRRTDTGSRLYIFRGLEDESQEECLARFDVYGGQPGKKLGTVAMKLRTADNENGFLIVNKMTKWEISEEPISQVEERDENNVAFSGGGDPFQMKVREGEHFTARQIFTSSGFRINELLSSKLCYGYEYPSGIDDAIEDGFYQLGDEGWEPAPYKTVTEVHREDGKKFTAEIPYVEVQGMPFTPYSVMFDGGYLERVSPLNPYRLVYLWDQNVTDKLIIVDGPWRLDFGTGEMTDLWGNVPKEDRREGINSSLSMIAFFQDGSFLIPCVDSEEPHDHYFLYVDPENGLVYDLEDLCGSELDDFTPVGEEIFCWKDGEYWRIPRDTMRPEYMGKLQENVVFASGVWGGDWASFSVEQLADGSYRIFDYLENRILTMKPFVYEELANCTWSEVSPDGRKVLLLASGSIPTVLDCDRRQLLTIDTGMNWTVVGSVEWTVSSELWISCVNQWGDWVYTLK